MGVIAFGALCAWVASRETLPQAWARVIFAADIAWVAGSVLVLALPATWTMAGFVGIVAVALIVADFAILEYLGLRRLLCDAELAPANSIRKEIGPWTSFSS